MLGCSTIRCATIGCSRLDFDHARGPRAVRFARSMSAAVEKSGRFCPGGRSTKFRACRLKASASQTDLENAML
jgi:hypothetical protein